MPSTSRACSCCATLCGAVHRLGAGASGLLLSLGHRLSIPPDLAHIRIPPRHRYPGAWHVIVGKHFGSFVTHETKSIVYFFVGAVGFLVFKHG